MARHCLSAWCHAQAEPGRDLCRWCYERRGCYADGMPRDPRHPWYQGPPKPQPDPLRQWFPTLVRGRDDA